tara:strand:+ start:5217 stop:5414 length:198 start_codon:yes stop_codon:yes gene_type:complete
MSVILVAFSALFIGGLLATVLSSIPRHKNACGVLAPVERNHDYNVCVMHVNHEGKHIAADGYRFE